MPEYLAAKAAVSLMVTDLLPVPEPNATAGNHLLREDLHVDSLQPASREIKQYQRGEVRKATETFFKGHDGVEFLGTDMPFYLVNAGLDLFRSRLTPNSGNVGHHAGASDVGPDSSLSIIPSSRCHSPIKPSEDGNGVRAQRNLPDNEDANAASPSISHKFPMSVNVVISVDPKMSFMANFYEYNADEKKQDLCVNILYNGELTTSRIIKPRTLDANATVEFAGRRIDSNLEVPWIVLPYLQVFKTNKGKAKLTTFVDRWDHISQLLLEEADKWLDYGQYRSPMGQYLFELSQIPCPGLENLEAGAKAGFVDVVITLGTTLSVNHASIPQRKPERKLHRNTIGHGHTLFEMDEPAVWDPADEEQLSRRQLDTISQTAQVVGGSKRSASDQLGKNSQVKHQKINSETQPESYVDELKRPRSRVGRGEINAILAPHDRNNPTMAVDTSFGAFETMSTNRPSRSSRAILQSRREAVMSAQSEPLSGTQTHFQPRDFQVLGAQVDKGVLTVKIVRKSVEAQSSTLRMGPSAPKTKKITEYEEGLPPHTPRSSYPVGVMTATPGSSDTIEVATPAADWKNKSMNEDKKGHSVSANTFTAKVSTASTSAAKVLSARGERQVAKAKSSTAPEANETTAKLCPDRAISTQSSIFSQADGSGLAISDTSRDTSTATDNQTPRGSLSFPSKPDFNLASYAFVLAEAKSPPPKPAPKARSHQSRPSSDWKPNDICQDSVLTYASVEQWNEVGKTDKGVYWNAERAAICRGTPIEREGMFRASGVLMGVRFVIGCEE